MLRNAATPREVAAFLVLLLLESLALIFFHLHLLFRIIGRELVKTQGIPSLVVRSTHSAIHIQLPCSKYDL